MPTPPPHQTQRGRMGLRHDAASTQSNKSRRARGCGVIRSATTTTTTTLVLILPLLLSFETLTHMYTASIRRMLPRMGLGSLQPHRHRTSVLVSAWSPQLLAQSRGSREGFSRGGLALSTRHGDPRSRLLATVDNSTSTDAACETPVSNSPAYALSSTPVDPLKDITWIQSCVVQVLNELYDAKQVALFKQQAALKKKKKKGDPPTPDPLDEVPTPMDTSGFPTRFTTLDAAVTVASRPEFGDYQCNAALGLAAAVSLSPRECAAQIIDALWRNHNEIAHCLEPPDIAGPGFVNLRYTQRYLCRAVTSMAADATGRCAVPTAAAANGAVKNRRPTQTIVVDYSSPNIAKEMHVGHLRSTILGDTLGNVLEFMGHKLVKLNHIGDWGTQFGMLVEHLRDEYPQALQLDTAETVDLGDLVVLYKAAKQRFDADDDFKQRARQGVVALQAGHGPERAAWQALCTTSRREYQKIYDTLNIKGLQERGESFYNPYLSNVVDDLTALGLAVESDGAMAVFLDGYTNRDGSPLPLLVRKSDGGFNYATTDLAAIRHRTSLPEGEHADRVLYVTDAGQSQHFDMVFAAARKANFVPDTVSLEHVPFGLVQGADGKKFATRSGDTVKLKDLLNEAVRIAGQDLRDRNDPSSANDEFQQRVERVSRIVGIGAVKYADLSLNRESNYRFSYDRMLSLNGNTAPYMLYAYARICGIIRKASGQGDNDTIVWPPVTSEIVITHETELDLMRNLVRLSDVIGEVERDLYPNRICDYLFETSQKFNKFYESCSVNQAETPELKTSRLSLCTATAGTIRLLLTLLGIEVVEKL